MKMRRALGALLLAATLTTCGVQLPLRAQDHAGNSRSVAPASADGALAPMATAPVAAGAAVTTTTSATGSRAPAPSAAEPVKNVDPKGKTTKSPGLLIRSADSGIRQFAVAPQPLQTRALPGTLGSTIGNSGSVPTWYAATLAALQAVQTPPPATAPAAPPAAPASRALPDQIEDPPFPMTTWTINSSLPIGENWDVGPGPLQHALFGTKYDNTPWRIVGWLDAGINYSTSKNSNLPLTYDLVPNKLELDQLVVELQKMPNTVQKDHVDWGFMSASLFGIDYRFTTAAGYLNDQLNTHNNLYGYDPVLQWLMVYFPKISDGAVLQVGRYISPIDIEAQLSNQNYLYSHSLMFGVDPYTYTGINMEVRINKEFMYFIGIHAGNENTPWSGRALPNAELLIGWASADNKDSLWGGLDSIGSGRTVKGHDNEQVFNWVWGHVWNKRLHMQTQAYYMWQYEPIEGGTPNNGPVEPYGGGGGSGPVIPGKAQAFGFVNNLEYKVNKRDYISLRSGYLGDPEGWRTGFPNRYCDFTLGYCHLFNSHIWFRPEIGFQHGFDTSAFDNGTKRDQVTIAADVLYRF